jgi:SNF2 family DNA or RNA helicase
MGLGKTIQSITLIITHPRPPLSTDPSTSSKTDKKKLSNSVGKGTLVVAPLALIKQWESEIANRVTSSHKLRVCVHHGPKRTKRFEDLRKYDVVITTYQVLVSEYSSSGDNDSGPQVGCFGIHWYRVILDEAHTIKNRNAKATQACYALRAEYRWCLTGTPMQNNLDELQSLIRFLRIKPYNELSVWRDQITRPMNAGRGGVAMKRLQFYLKAFMKRRTKDILKEEGALNPGGKASIEGEPDSGFKITERKIEDVICEFSENERTFYEKLQQRTDKSLEKMMDASKMSYASALVLLLRLRQACNHPELVGGDIRADKDALTTGQSNGSKKMSNGDRDVDDIADLLGGLSVQTKQCDVCQLDLTEEESRSGSIRCGTCENDMMEFKKSKKVLKKSKNRRKEEKGNKPEVLPRVRKNRNIIHDSDDDEEGEGEWIVAKNERHVLHLGIAGGQDDENAESGCESLASNDSNSDDETLPELDQLHKKKFINLIDSEADDNSSTSESEEEEDEDSSEEGNSELDAGMSKIPSAKVIHLLEILRRESKTHKFIVFSQFTSMLNLIEPFLRAEGLIFTRYDGSMRNDQREASLDRLRNEKKTRILLCSLKCGSLGLNLTAASRVVIMEPFWNPVSTTSILTLAWVHID